MVNPKKALTDMMMLQYKDGMRDGMKSVRETLDKTLAKLPEDPTMVPGIAFARMIIDVCIAGAEEEAVKHQASQEKHGL